ncbi:hypothetical protein Lal_00044928 [Lupinus albus]|nr:hypothetical protein Lal_00044928 [Lupinus albus]
MILKRLQEGKSQRRIEPATTFWRAEEYHQHYYKKHGAGILQAVLEISMAASGYSLPLQSPLPLLSSVQQQKPQCQRLLRPCPPADRLLSELSRDKRRSVIALSEHVDYWDYLGWKDPNSSRAFSDRQNLYAHKMRLASVYTPQVVVNGVAEAVGNNRASIEDAISKTVDERLKRLLVRCQLSPDRRSVKIEVEPFPLARATNAFIANLALTADGIPVRGDFCRWYWLSHCSMTEEAEQVPKNELDRLMADIRACTICQDHLPLGPHPILQVAGSAKILIAGQAPGKKVHESGVPFDDQSGAAAQLAWFNKRAIL